MIDNDQYRLSGTPPIGAGRRAEDLDASTFESLLQNGPDLATSDDAPADPVLTTPPYLASDDDDIDYEQALDAAWERGYVELDDNEDTGPIWAPDVMPDQFA